MAHCGWGISPLPDVSAIAAALAAAIAAASVDARRYFMAQNHGCRIEVMDCNGILHNGSESEERPLLPDAKRCSGSATEVRATEGASYRWSATNFRVRPVTASHVALVTGRFGGDMR